MKNKKGVIRIIEAILAIMILLGVVLVLIQKQPVAADFSTSVYKVQSQILSEISGSSVYRNAVLSSDNQKIECYIQSRLQKYSLDFNTSVCNPLSACYCDAPKNIELYSADIIVSSNLTSFQPKRLLRCSWIGTLTQRDCAPVGPTCGNNIIEGTEICDGTALAGKTCMTQGFNAGTLSCSNCNFNTAGCCNNDCSPSGQKVCEGNSWKQCGNYDADPCLEWSGLTACSGATPVCSGGNCAASCSDECAAGSKGCIGNAYWACGQHDADSCLDIGPLTNCPASGTCVGTSGQRYTGSCSAGNCLTEAAPAESCDGIDNDCDGTTTDEAGVCPTSYCTATDASGKLYDFIFKNSACIANCGDIYKSLLSTSITLKYNINAYTNYSANCNNVYTPIDKIMGQYVDLTSSDKTVCVQKNDLTACDVRIVRKN